LQVELSREAEGMMPRSLLWGSYPWFQDVENKNEMMAYSTNKQTNKFKRYKIFFNQRSWQVPRSFFCILRWFNHVDGIIH
jgi:hypothetical protein